MRAIPELTVTRGRRSVRVSAEYRDGRRVRILPAAPGMVELTVLGARRSGVVHTRHAQLEAVAIGGFGITVSFGGHTPRLYREQMSGADRAAVLARAIDLAFCWRCARVCDWSGLDLVHA